MEQNRLKIRNASKRMTIILRIGGVISGIIAMLALTGICILIFSNEETKLSFLSAFHVTANNGTIINIHLQELLLMFAFMLVDAILITIIILFVHAIFNHIQKEDTPFSHQNTIRIKKIAIITIILSIVGSYSDALVDYYTIGQLTWKINIVGLIVGIIIYCISLIFDYGCELQQQSDETL